jgi:hypothetical protein
MIRHLRRIGGWMMIAGGILGVVTRYIWFLAHGPTGFDENNLVLGMRTLGATRLDIFPTILSIFTIVAFYYTCRHQLNRTGQGGLLAVLVGTVLSLFSLVWDYFLFPHPHPLFGIGWGVLLLGVIPLTMLGWLAFGLVLRGQPTFPTWVKILPFILSVAVVFGFFYDPAPNPQWSKLTQFLFANEMETIVYQLAWIGLGVFLLRIHQIIDFREVYE